MNIPSLAIPTHEHYSPELRDKISDLLRVQASGASYHLLTPTQLRALADIESPEAPVVSLYLQLDADRRIGHAWHTAFNSLRTATLKPIGDRRKWQAMKDEFDRIQQALEDELPALGRGVAFFVCRQRDLWQQTAVSVPLPDAVHLDPKPYLRPLVRTQDEHDRFVLAVLSQELNRFFVSQIGQVEEVLQITAPNPRKVARGHHGPRDDKEGSVLDEVKHEARILAHAADLVLTGFEGRYLLLSGATLMRAEAIQELPKHLQQRVGEQFAVEIHARPAEVAAAAQPAQRIIEEREETATVQRLIDAGPNASAWGVQPTLNALREGRVMTLVVEDSFTTPGARCRNCLALWQAMGPTCGACGSDSIEPVDDVAELAIEDALEEKAALEMVCSHSGRQLLARIGPMAALLRW
jgi:peptide subunit release factor 1 (eRF1)